MRAVAEADRGRGAGDFLLRYDMLEITQAEAAKLLLHGDAMKPELSHRLPKVTRKLVRRVDFGGDRRDLVVGEALCAVADGVGHFAEVEVESGSDMSLSCSAAPLAERTCV